MKNSKLSRLFILFAIFLNLGLSSCDLGNSPVIRVPQPPSALKANAQSPSTIGLTWRASRTTVIGYDVKVFDELGTPLQSLKLGDVTSIQIRNLQEGKLYVFQVFSRSQDTISNLVEIRWATATRFSGRLYVGPGKQNGINFLEQKTYTADRASSWDLCLEVDSSGNQPAYRLSTPAASSVSDVNGFVMSGTDRGKKVRITQFFNDVYDPFIFTGIDSLQHLYFSAPIGEGYTPLENLADNIQNFSRGFVLAFKTQQNNHVLFHVKENNSQIIRRDASGTYIEFEASVQRTPNLPYGKIRG